MRFATHGINRNCDYPSLVFCLALCRAEASRDVQCPLYMFIDLLIVSSCLGSNVVILYGYSFWHCYESHCHRKLPDVWLLQYYYLIYCKVPSALGVRYITDGTELHHSVLIRCDFLQKYVAKISLHDSTEDYT